MSFTRLGRRACRLAAGVLLVLTAWQPVYGAPREQEPTPAAERQTTYIIQAGDTLFGIAEAFAVPMDLLAEVNGIQDPALISVGQQLVIPTPPAEAGPSLEHIVQPGETLRTLSLRYQRATAEIAASNYLLRPDYLAIGDELVIQGVADDPGPARGQTVFARPGETLVGLALQHHSSLWQLATVNQLRSPNALPSAGRIWIPGPEGEFFDWPQPLGSVRLHPLPAVQGQTLSIEISTTLPVSLTGSLMGDPLVFHFSHGAQFALAGIDALEAPGAHTLSIAIAGQLLLTQPIRLHPGEYYSETIEVLPEIAEAMTASVVLSETQLLGQVFSLHSDHALWSAPMALPSTYPVSSLFGTRRTYNIPNGSAYHSGTDFAAPEWTPVLAPADGVVVVTDTLTVRGNIVVLDHGWGVMTGYWHLAKVYVSPGDMVQAGDHIADSGNTGLSTGPHLHWEFRVGNVPVSGLQWVTEPFP